MLKRNVEECALWAIEMRHDMNIFNGRQAGKFEQKAKQTTDEFELKRNWILIYTLESNNQSRSPNESLMVDSERNHRNRIDWINRLDSLRSDRIFVPRSIYPCRLRPVPLPFPTHTSSGRETNAFTNIILKHHNMRLSTQHHRCDVIFIISKWDGRLDEALLR